MRQWFHLWFLTDAGLVRIKLNLNIFVLMFIREMFVTCKHCDFKSLVCFMLSGFIRDCVLCIIFVCQLYLGDLCQCCFMCKFYYCICGDFFFCIFFLFFFCISYFDGRLLVLMILFEALYEWRPLYLMSLLGEEVVCYVLILAD